MAVVKSALQVLLGMWLLLGRPIAGFILLFGLAGIAFQAFNLTLRALVGWTFEPWPGAEVSFYRLGVSVLITVASLAALYLTAKIG